MDGWCSLGNKIKSTLAHTPGPHTLNIQSQANAASTIDMRCSLVLLVTSAGVGERGKGCMSSLCYGRAWLDGWGPHGHFSSPQ